MILSAGENTQETTFKPRTRSPSCPNLFNANIVLFATPFKTRQLISWSYLSRELSSHESSVALSGRASGLVTRSQLFKSWIALSTG